MNEMAYELKTSITCINHKLHPHWKSVLPPQTKHTQKMPHISQFNLVFYYSYTTPT